MKTSKMFKLVGIILIGLSLSTQVEAFDGLHRKSAKKTITLSVDKPVLEFMAKAYADQIDAKDIVRMQKVLGQIDHITISFRDADASDYVLTFKALDENGLEDWMFNEGYLVKTSEPEVAAIETWMMDPTYLD